MKNNLKQYLPLFQKVISSITEEQLFLPIQEVGIDSLDLIVIRVDLEKHFGYQISDLDWYQLPTLAEVILYFQNAIGNKIIVPLSASENISEQRIYEMQMPQMANTGLSENWLLKEMGDMHWSLLSQGIQQKSSEFKDEKGNRLYATFARISLSTAPLNKFLENESLSLEAQIQRFGLNSYFSQIHGMCADKELRATLMTTFTKRDQQDNSQISKGTIQIVTNRVQEMSKTPEFLNEYRLLRKKFLPLLPPHDFDCTLSTDESEIFYAPNPFYDINGVGLLYFSSYPVISDICLAELMKSSTPDFVSSYDTIYRDIFYYANCNNNDRVIAHLDSISKLENDQLKISSSLYRSSDNTQLARIFTIKQRRN